MTESAEFRWGNVTECCNCGSSDIARQTAEEGRPFSCNNCGLEFFKDTGLEGQGGEPPSAFQTDISRLVARKTS